MQRSPAAARWLAGLALLALCAVGAPATAKAPKGGTNLLFSFVSHQGGFDTTLIFANTSVDLFGTLPADGTCTLHFFGTNPPAPTQTPSIGAGTVFTTTAGALAPSFQGYVIAVCDAPLLHGLATIGPIGGDSLAGYPALVIPPGKRKKLERLDE